jgi:uncharacterized repeat protein (TIGR03803 family)
MKIRLLCCFLLACQWCFAATEKTVYSFSAFPHGKEPLANVTFDSAGNIYGTTCSGGTHDDGTVFKLTAGKNGSYTQTVLHSFSGSDGACPAGGVVLDSAGDIYGTASTGGTKSSSCFQASGCGLVFKLTPSGSVWKQQILYKFSGSDYASDPSSLTWYGGNLVGTAGPPPGWPDWNEMVFMLTPSGTAWNFTTLYTFPATGSATGPVGPLVVDGSGNLYGATTYGGTSGGGIVFELSFSGSTVVESVVHSFGARGDGSAPYSGLTIDQAGNLYGATSAGGTLDQGAIYKLTRDTRGNWNEAVIYSFSGGTDGWAPIGGVVLDGAGNVYGTTTAGGIPNCSCGTAFELSPNSGGTYTKKTLHLFSGYSQLGTLAAVVLDSQGNLYGTTPFGNGHINSSDQGTVYRLSPGSSGWTYTVVYGFPASDGREPGAGPTFDSAGNLYGTTIGGGSSEAGTVYELSPAGNGVWTEKLLYTFRGGNDGAYPRSNVVIDSSGNLFGTTSNGGGGSSAGGTVFELSPNGTGWKETILHTFQSNGIDGTFPLAGLTRDASGNFFGTTNLGGTYGFGTVFKMTQSSSGTWSESVLYSFTGGADGSESYAPITIDSAGNLYGSTKYGGAHGVGAIFVLSPKSDGSYTESVLHSFTGSTDGVNPSGSLTLDAAGNLYGVAAQVAFELSPSSSGWTETVLYTFGDVSYPGGLTFDASGNLWGTAAGGGASNDGGVFELSPSGGQWKENQVIQFSGLLGIAPTGSVIFDGAGNLYGAAFKGGKTGDGVVFEITP